MPHAYPEIQLVERPAIGAFEDLDLLKAFMSSEVVKFNMQSTGLA